MPTKAYLGISSKASALKSIYLGSGSIAHKIKKAYIGVGNSARLWWTAKSQINPTPASTVTVNTGDHYHVFAGNYVHTKSRIIRNTKGGGIYNLVWIDTNYVYGTVDHQYDSYSGFAALTYGPTIIGAGTGWLDSAQRNQLYEAYNANMVRSILNGTGTAWENCNAVTLCDTYICFSHGNHRSPTVEDRYSDQIVMFDRNYTLRSFAAIESSYRSQFGLLIAAKSYSIIRPDGEYGSLNYFDANLVEHNTSGGISRNNGAVDSPNEHNGSSVGDYILAVDYDDNVRAYNCMTGHLVDITSTFSHNIVGYECLPLTETMSAIGWENRSTYKYELYQLSSDLVLDAVAEFSYPPSAAYGSGVYVGGILGEDRLCILSPHYERNDNADDMYMLVYPFYFS